MSAAALEVIHQRSKVKVTGAAAVEGARTTAGVAVVPAVAVGGVSAVRSARRKPAWRGLQ